MLIESLLGLILTASCDLTKAALGGCASSCPENTSPGSFSICESQVAERDQARDSVNTPAPQRLCQYYVNGTIDVPTMTVITAWVDIGSRLCIGDPIPEPVKVVRTLREELEDIFSAKLESPNAWLTSRSRPETYEPVGFAVDAFSVTAQGELFGQPATIRFRPVRYNWSFSDDSTALGEAVTKAFVSEGRAWGQASVLYEVDYRKSGDWTYDAASWSLTSNRVYLEVFDPPRKTLLVP